jgi:hypothetical protein
VKPAWLLWAVVFAPPEWAARCTTDADARALQEYDHYVANAAPVAASGFANPLTWVPANEKRQAAAKLESGKAVRKPISLTDTNRRMADWNGTIIHLVGAVKIRNARVEDLKAVLQDYDHYASIYRPMIYQCRARPVTAVIGSAFEVVYGYQSVYRAAALFPQVYSFQVQSHADFREEDGAATLAVHSQAKEIRESDSGVPGRNDFLEPYHDHGVLWALNTYWRARRDGPDLYVEFEAITLARSLRDFSCFPVPKAIVSRVMDSLPGESMDLMLTATKAECERRVARLKPVP